MQREFICDDCNTEYEIVTDSEDESEFCPFCGWRIVDSYQEEIEETDDGC